MLWDKDNLNQLIKGWLRTEDGPGGPEWMVDRGQFVQQDAENKQKCMQAMIELQPWASDMDNKHPPLFLLFPPSETQI